jgi:hypothetical protein
MKDLYKSVGVPKDGSPCRYSHITAQQLDLQGHDRFANPDKCEDAGEDQILLISACSERKKQTQEKTEDKRSPRSASVTQFVILADVREDIP